MIVLSNSEEQTVLPGQAIVFDITRMHSGCGEFHRQGSSAVKMKQSGIYEISFHGNIGGTSAGEVQLSIETGGEVLPETTMISTVSASGDFNNVGAETRVRNFCSDYDRITVVNTGTTDVIVGANAALIVGRRA